MSDAEIRSQLNRFKLETEYKRMIESQQPKKTLTKGQKFAQSLMNNVVKPAAVDAGRDAVTNLFKRGLNNLLNNPPSANKKKNSNNYKTNTNKKTYTKKSY